MGIKEAMTDKQTFGEMLTGKREQTPRERIEAAPCKRVIVRNDAVEWLKTNYPVLCEKSGLCELVGGKLYTRSFLQIAEPDLIAERVAHDKALQAMTHARNKLRDCLLEVRELVSDGDAGYVQDVIDAALAPTGAPS